jgi:iron complex outermembrane receptor protein
MQSLTTLARFSAFIVIIISQSAWAGGRGNIDSASPIDVIDADELVTIGTRTDGRLVADSPVPVDLMTAEAMVNSGHTEVGRMLQSLAPSFNFSSSSISDGSDALRPATLRGLGPDQTLVLINGKRRHGSALVHVNTSVGRGTAGTDMNAIPASAIKRIEVLRDGASAQYGSDAIAGVINIVLKDYDEGGQISGSYGQYQEGDGETFVASLNQGFAMADGFLNLDFEYRDRSPTNRAGLSGQCQYSCTDIGGGVMQSTDPREAVFKRQNFRIGDADSEQLSGTLNLGLPLSGDLELYAFATYSTRDNESAGFYRRANAGGDNPTFRFDGVTEVNGGQAFIPDGFLPKINTDIEDISINGGLTGSLGEWDWDAGFGYAMNKFGFNISNSINASLVSATGSSPRSADAGELELGQYTFDVDFTRPMSWGNLAVGVAYREDSFQEKAGELLSYADFDTIDGMSIGALDADAGIEVFPGFSPANAVDEDRDAWSLYLDAEYDAFDRWRFGGAVRFEDYSDFGSTTNFKLTAAFDWTDNFMLRGAVSTGFRAPSLQQQFFNNTSTQFDSMGVAQQVGTFRNDSPVAQAIGIPELEEEESFNLSAGFVWEPNDASSLTVDVYSIDIDDRIVISGDIALGLDPDLDIALMSVGASQAQFFLNAADTSTEGVDIIYTYALSALGGDWNLGAAANFTDTEIDSVKAPSSLSSVVGIGDVVFPSQDRSILTEWQPEDRIGLTSDFVRDMWGWNIAFNRYGEYTIEDGDRQTFGEEWVVDTQVRYSFDSGLTLKIGGNNIFDATPDINTVGQSRTGTIVDGSGNTIVDTAGVFQYSRRSAPFGFNGAYWYAGADFNF